MSHLNIPWNSFSSSPLFFYSIEWVFKFQLPRTLNTQMFQRSCMTGHVWPYYAVHQLLGYITFLRFCGWKEPVLQEATLTPTSPHYFDRKYRLFIMWLFNILYHYCMPCIFHVQSSQNNVWVSQVSFMWLADKVGNALHLPPPPWLSINEHRLISPVLRAVLLLFTSSFQSCHLWHKAEWALLMFIQPTGCKFDRLDNESGNRNVTMSSLKTEPQIFKWTRWKFGKVRIS